MTKRYYKGKKVIGVPVGYKENWKYSAGLWQESKVGHGKWKFRYRANKRRKAKSYGGLGKGSTGKWYIKGIQRIRKTGLGQYKTDFRGTKKSLGFKIKRRY